jgi:hypothetical protein
MNGTETAGAGMVYLVVTYYYTIVPAINLPKSYIYYVPGPARELIFLRRATGYRNPAFECGLKKLEWEKIQEVLIFL